MIRVALVDDLQLFRDGLQALLEAEGDIQVVFEASTGRELLAAVDALAFDVLVLDVTLPGPNGVAVLRELRRRGRREPVLMLTMHHEADVVFDALAAGASGYAVKQQPREEILAAIRAVAGGERYVAPSLAGALPQPPVRDAERVRDGGILSTLSAREREIFDLLVRGYSNPKISRELSISLKTVDTHRQHIMKKLSAHTITDLMRMAVRRGLVV